MVPFNKGWNLIGNEDLSNTRQIESQTEKQTEKRVLY